MPAWATGAWADGAWAVGAWSTDALPDPPDPVPTPTPTVQTPIPELIALEIIARLEAITEGNGYEFTVPFVERVNRDGRNWTPKANAIAVVQGGDEERVFDNDCPGSPPSNAYMQTWEIRGCVRKPEYQDYAEDSDVNQMTASIRKAIAEGSTGWFTFDGNCYNAQFGPSRIEKTTDGTFSVVELMTYYRVSEIDPYTLRN